jgi:WD40 repeat protein
MSEQDPRVSISYNPRRRRRASFESDQEVDNTTEGDISSVTRVRAARVLLDTSAGGKPSPSKRQRTSGTMHPDSGKATMDPSTHTNGSHSPSSDRSMRSGLSNGTHHTNGNVDITRCRTSSYFGHSRSEVSRLIIQALQDLGYQSSANAMIQESKYELESPKVTDLRNAVLNGNWARAEALLVGTNDPGSEGGVSIENGTSDHNEAICLVQGADHNDIRFQIRRQRFLELLEKDKHLIAMKFLQRELTPLCKDNQGTIRSLSSLLVCQSADDLRSKAKWDGAGGSSRNDLLAELSRSISPSMMIPNHRLADLLDQVQQAQISKCVYHNPTTTFSLFSDHLCDRQQFPLQTIHRLQQREEVWFLAFSPNGKMLATCGKDKSVTIYETDTFDEVHKLADHKNTIPYIAWDPSSTKLVSCSQDKTAKVWDMETGRLLASIINHTEPVTTAAWLPDGQSFVTGSLDKRQPLNLWSQDGTFLHKWPANHRVQDLAVSPDGKRLVTISPDKQVYVYNLITKQEEYSMVLQKELTCVNISKDSKHILVNLAENELQLIDLDSAEVVQRFIGQKQGTYIIRSTFGGTDENLVLSGSESECCGIAFYPPSIR